MEFIEESAKMIEKCSLEAEEIVFRNKGDIDDLLHHINQDFHLTTILYSMGGDTDYNNFLQTKATNLLRLKTELQQALAKYNKEENLRLKIKSKEEVEIKNG